MMNDVIGIREAEISVISHATENEGKVNQALKNLIGATDEYDFSVTIYKSHHGSQLRLHKIKLKSKDANTFLQAIICDLGEGDFNILLSTLAERLDQSGNLYIRVSKQDAYKGILKLYEGDDSIRILLRIKFHNRRKDTLALWKNMLIHLRHRCTNNCQHT